jgi:hypothetical protein
VAKLLKNWLTRLGSKMKGGFEFQVGLQALTQERDASGLNFVEPAKQPAQAFSASPVSALA